MDIPFDKTLVNKDSLKDGKNRRKARYDLKKKFEERCVCCVHAHKQRLWLIGLLCAI